MSQERTETIEQEDEMMSSEAFDLAADLNSTVSYGESLGVFTPKEAMEWYVGIDACRKVSHLRGLIPYLNKFIASGEARLRQVEKAANSDLLTAAEQHGYANEASGITYQAKGQLVEEIKSLVSELRSLRSRLISILDKKPLDTADKSRLISQFYSASATGKNRVVGEAESTPDIDTKKSTIAEKTERSAAATNTLAPSQLELVEQTVSPKDPKSECLTLVDLYLRHKQFRQAADLAEASSRYFNLAEYRALLKQIDTAKIKAEVPELRALLQAA